MWFFLLFLARWGFHRDNFSAQPKKLFRILEMLFVFPHQIRRQVREVFLSKSNGQDVPSQDFIDLSVFIPKRPIQRQAIQLSFLIYNQGQFIRERISVFTNS